MIILLYLKMVVRQKFYFISIARYVQKWVHGCEICIRDKHISNTRMIPEKIHFHGWIFGPDDVMQINLLPELLPSGRYENIVTAIGFFSRHAFADPVFNPTATNTGKDNTDIMTRHAYLPTFIKTDKWSVFVSQVIHEVAEILSIYLKRATTKHAETIKVLERAHATIKTFRKRYRANTGNNGPNKYPLQSWITTPSSIPVFPVLPVHQAQHFVTEFYITSYISNWVCNWIPISHLLRILQMNHSAEPKAHMTKQRKASCSQSYIKYKK